MVPHWEGPRPVDWPSAAALATARLRLEPVAEEHAPAMVGVLADPELYRVIGGDPPSEQALRRSYRLLEHPLSPDGTQGWLNWIVFDGDRAVGTVQATVLHDPGLVAELAWIVGTAFQRRGVASEAASAVAGWLRDRGVGELRANVAPGHTPSEGVAAGLGMRPTDVLVDGEVRWASV